MLAHAAELTDHGRSGGAVVRRQVAQQHASPLGEAHLVRGRVGVRVRVGSRVGVKVRVRFRVGSRVEVGVGARVRVWVRVRLGVRVRVQIRVRVRVCPRRTRPRDDPMPPWPKSVVMRIAS